MGTCRTPGSALSRSQGKAYKAFPSLFASPPQCPDTRMLSCGSSVPTASAHAPTSPGKEGMWALMWGIQVSTNPDPSPPLSHRAALCSHPIFHPTLWALPFIYSCACSCSPRTDDGVGFGRREEGKEGAWEGLAVICVWAAVWSTRSPGWFQQQQQFGEVVFYVQSPSCSSSASSNTVEPREPTGLAAMMLI